MRTGGTTCYLACQIKKEEIMSGKNDSKICLRSGGRRGACENGLQLLAKDLQTIFIFEAKNQDFEALSFT